jgi:drug/metabolite transporter (DMT)-like permease
VTAGVRWQRWLPEFVALGTIWGSSFVFMRMASQQFGPWTTAWLRVSIALLVLFPWLLWRGQSGMLKTHWRGVMGMGVVNAAIPFCCYAFAVLWLSTGMSSILNATSPLFGALIAWVWLGERPGHWRLLGLGLGFVGVGWLASGMPGGLSFSGQANGWAVLACLLATTCYGLGTAYSQRYLQSVPALTMATGSLLGACVVLALPGMIFWPQRWPDSSAWLGLLMVGAICTGLAYVFYFRLVAKTGGARTLSVTYVIPLVANVIGVVLLDETITWQMLWCGVLILMGTALANGLLPVGRRG